MALEPKQDQRADGGADNRHNQAPDNQLVKKRLPARFVARTERTQSAYQPAHNDDQNAQAGDTVDGVHVGLLETSLPGPDQVAGSQVS
jgi:hypothetical protein